MSIQIKLIILALALAAFLGLGWTAKHYHDKFVQVTAELSAQEVKLNTALAAAKNCSEATDKLKKISDEKQGIVAVEQTKAAEENKKQVKTANTILTVKPLNNDVCESAKALIEQYRVGIFQ